MKRVLATVALMIVAGSVPAVPPAKPVPPTPAKLVEQLNSEAYADREAATAALEALGEAARPALEQAVRSPNPETATRVAKLLTALQRSADAAHRFDVKTVKLAYRKVPLGTAVNDLKARTGINLALDPEQIADPLRLVTCETGDVAPWEAVSAFCQAAGLKEVFELELPLPKQERSRRGIYQAPPPPPTQDAVPVKLVDGTAQLLPGSRTTAVRVLALPANFAKHRCYLGSGDILFHFDVAPMPGYHWQSVAGVRITKVVDDANRPGAAGTNREPGGLFSDMFEGMAFAGPGGGIAIGFDGEIPNRITGYANPRIVPVPIRLGTPNAKKLKLLEGAVVCEIAVPDQPLITIGNVGNSLGQGVEGNRGLKLTVLETKPPAAKGGKAVLKVQLDQPPAWLNNRFNNPWGGIVIDDMIATSNPTHVVRGYNAAGKPVRMTVLTNSETNSDEFTMSTVTQYACPDGLPEKVVLFGPKPVLVEVPFKMENVLLP